MSCVSTRLEGKLVGPWVKELEGTCWWRGWSSRARGSQPVAARIWPLEKNRFVELGDVIYWEAGG